MNEPVKHCENLSDALKLKLMHAFIMSSLPPMVLLRMLVAVVMKH